MSSDRAYFDFILEQLSALEELSWRAMMGEFILYYRGKVVGGVYDDRFLLKATPGALRLMRQSPFGLQMELPYEGGKEMLLADVDDPALCCRVIRAIAEDLPAPKRKP